VVIFANDLGSSDRSVLQYHLSRHCTLERPNVADLGGGVSACCSAGPIFSSTWEMGAE